MWSPNNLKRLQTDPEADCQHIFLEKRQRAVPKKRKKVSAPNSEHYSLGVAHPSSLISLPGLSNKRLTRKLGSLSNGVQGSVPAIRKVQQKLDQDLEQRLVDFSSFKGPPKYRNLPKPAMFEEKHKQKECSRDQPVFLPKSRSRNSSRRKASSRDSSQLSRSQTEDEDMLRVFQQINDNLSYTITNTWPNIGFEDRLQTSLNRKITERFAARAQRVTPPRAKSEQLGCGSGSSSTALSKSFSTWYINGETDSAADFNKSFCQTIKRTFFKPPLPSPEQEKHVTSPPPHVTSSRPHVTSSRPHVTSTHSRVTSPIFEIFDCANVSASALDLFKNLPRLESSADSGRGSATDFLDTITDGYDPYNNVTFPDTPASQPDLVIRGVKKDFIDVVDNLYQDEILNKQHSSARGKPYVSAVRRHVTQRHQPISEQYSSHQPISEQYSSHQPISEQYSSHQPISEQYSSHVIVGQNSNKENKKPSSGRKRMKNKQFYLRKEWLK